MLRRHLMIGGAATAAMALMPGGAEASNALVAPEGAPFNAEDVLRAAKALAEKPFSRAEVRLPSALNDLSYDQYRMIRFDRAHALWRGTDVGFELQPAHRGFLFRERVALHEVSEGMARPLTFARQQFTYGEAPTPLEGEDIGFAGARLLAPLNRPGHFDEVVSFLGASYFRALGRGHIYGISARGLAIATADPKGEEFPAFRAFWFERPEQGARQAVVHALLDSESLAGAYSFVVRPGETTTMDVDAHIFPRRDVPLVGIAPLTSMYLHGPNDRGRIDDYRPAVHDSDGLLMQKANGERVWRPLTNPRTLQVSAFADESPSGFGLMQRRREYADFHDLEALYHRRPSLWVEPLDRWASGKLHLVEIPTDGEIHDNIAAFWRPDDTPKKGQPLRLRYRLHWCARAPIDTTLASFDSTRVGQGSGTGMRRFVLDALGPALAELPSDTDLKLEVWSSRGSLHHAAVHRNAVTGGLRVAFELRPDGANLVELGARVLSGETAITETWLYRWTA